MLKSYFALQAFLAGRLNRDDRGATGVEYGLIVAAIAAVIIVVVFALGVKVQAAFQAVVDNWK